LVINDVPVLLEIMRELLEEEGYRVSLDTFSDMDLGKRFAELKRLKPDVLVLDLIVGGEVLGWQLLQMVKLDRATARIPVVICTAAARQAEELGPHLRTLGVAVILKPFDIDALVGAVAQALAGGSETGLSPAPPA
jgi:CheY-like chemotaxis protein